MIKEVIEKTGSLIPILTIVFGSVSIRGLFVSFFTSLSYDSFDMRLLPRGRFAVIKFKKIISVFLLIIPVYCGLAFLLAYEAIIFPVFVWIFSIAFLVITFGITLSYLISILEYIYIKSDNFRWLLWVREILGKLSKIFEINTKAKVYIIFTFLLLSLIMLAYGYFADVKIILTSLTEYLITMIGVSFLFIYSIKPDTRPVEYIFIEEDDNLDELLEKYSVKKELKLEYFLSDSIAVFSTKDKEDKEEYKVIKRISEPKSIFEVYKALKSD
ncbi:hypothetical protein [Lysinibacillus sphaericus]|uniref:Uncharacterized protein n=1 Tax=Lysinibacillus sphaericus OT4b.31 TaxID=1285586 RepID=R7ZJ24_LYSSH|nr:hypothetical protein [Lysinibacillus sphaericus]EON74117.1 hypothetical protein H131_01508 [Lysinibacillus sphaericus OT4b.31]